MKKASRSTQIPAQDGFRSNQTWFNILTVHSHVQSMQMNNNTPLLVEY